MSICIRKSHIRLFFTALFGLMLICGPLLAAAQSAESVPGIIPAPVLIKRNAGTFSAGKNLIIYAEGGSDRSAKFLVDYLREQRGVNARVIHTSAKAKILSTGIVLTANGSASLPECGYKLVVAPKKITLTGKDAGMFYAVQSLIQLFPVQTKAANVLPCVTIEDYPRFEYRGLMLDVSRHFFTTAYVKKLINLMAAYKLNTFHWHLVDNEGWRIQIKKYPKLTEVGGFRQNTIIDGNRDWPDEVPYGGFYTQDEIKDVVKYAADRYIEVIPEIEMPAHSLAALRAYPEYKVEPPADGKITGSYNIIYQPSEQTFQFLQDVLTEVIPLFPSKYIHIGGDEANKTPWETSAFCQKLMHDLNLKDTHALQSYFIQRMEKFLNAKGKSIIGWDEILEGGLAPNAAVMSWRGEAGGIAAARQKHSVIMTPGSKGMYFDYYQSNSPQEPVNIGGYAPLAQTYNYNPVSDSLTKEEQVYVKGVQGNIWTEFIGTPAKIEYMMLPRLFALAEIAWTLLDKKDFDNFSRVRMPQHLAKIDAAGFNYRVPTAIGIPERDTTMVGANFTFNLALPLPGAKIYYTLNGRIPDNTDLEYVGPLVFTIPENQSREIRTVVISSSGKHSVATRTILDNKTLSPITK